jgi:glutamine amidotransferase-like uncharacterized protein
MLHIGLYNSRQGSKNGSIGHVLSFLFRDTGIAIIETDQNNFTQRDPRYILGDVFPGSLTGTAYRQQLVQNGNLDFLKNTMSQHGSTTLTICAMSYNVCEEFHYTNPFTNEYKHIQSEIALVPHIARGPDMNLYQPLKREENNPWSVYNATKIQFTDYDGQHTSGYFAISQAPSLYPQGHAHQVIGHYDRTQDVAIMEQKMGRGHLIMSGPAIEIGGYNLRNYTQSKNATLYQKQGREIVQKLAQSDEAWRKLWLRIGASFVKDDPLYITQLRHNLDSMRLKHIAVPPSQNKFAENPIYY